MGHIGADAAEVQRLEMQLGDLRWVNRQREARIAQMQREIQDTRGVARELEASLGRAAGLFLPLRDLHQVATWEGDAAKASRRRLDEHEDRYLAARQAVDHVIVDLETQAATADRHVGDERAARSRTSGHIAAIERELRQM